MKKIRNQFLIWRDFFFFQILGFDNLFTFTNWRNLVCWHWKIYSDFKINFFKSTSKNKILKICKVKNSKPISDLTVFLRNCLQVDLTLYYFILTGNSIHKIITNLLRQKKNWIWIRFSGFEFLFSFISRFAPELSNLFWFNFRG